VRETTITYEAASGTIEVVGRQKATREKIARAFAEVILEHEITDERLPQRRYDLSPLLSPKALHLSPEDGIARAKVTMLALSTLDESLTQRFEVSFADDVSLHAALDGHFGEMNPLRSDLLPRVARIEIEFEPPVGRRRGKKVNVELAMPNKCSLRGKTARERLILGSYLRSWGLARGVDA
jgi:hypothetical protein